MKWIVSLSGCPELLFDDGFATKKKKKNTVCAQNDRNYLPSVHIIQVFQSRSSSLKLL